jgi:hypothetical protein
LAHAQIEPTFADRAQNLADCARFLVERVLTRRRARSVGASGPALGTIGEKLGTIGGIRDTVGEDRLLANRTRIGLPNL